MASPNPFYPHTPESEARRKALGALLPFLSFLSFLYLSFFATRY